MSNNFSVLSYFAHTVLGDSYPKLAKNSNIAGRSFALHHAISEHFGSERQAQANFQEFSRSAEGKLIADLDATIQEIRSKYPGNKVENDCKISHTIQNISCLKHLNACLYIPLADYDEVISRLLPFRNYIRLSANPKNIPFRLGYDLDIKTPISQDAQTYLINQIDYAEEIAGSEPVRVQTRGNGIHIQTFRYFTATENADIKSMADAWKKIYVDGLKSICRNAVGDNDPDTVFDESHNQALPYFATIKKGVKQSTVYEDMDTPEFPADIKQQLAIIKSCDVSYVNPDNSMFQPIEYEDFEIEAGEKLHAERQATKTVNAGDFDCLYGREIDGVVVDDELIRYVISQSPKLNTRQSFYGWLMRIKEAIPADKLELLYSAIDARCSKFEGYNRDNNRQIFNSCKVIKGGFAQLLASIQRKPTVPQPSTPTTADITVDSNYISHVIDEHFDHDVIAVSSRCNTGKSFWLRQKFEEYDHDSKSFMLFGFRRSLNIETVGKLRKNINMMYYEDDEFRKSNAKLPTDHLAVQFESIRKTELAPVDLLVIDEIRSFIDQQSADLLNKRSEITLNNAVLQFHIQNAGKIVLLDDQIDNVVLRWIGRYRAEKPFVIYNSFQPFSERKAFIANDRGEWNLLVKTMVESGDKLYIPTNYGEDQCIKLQAWIESLKPGIKVFQITGNSSESKKQDCFKNVEESWSNYDVVIASPVVQAGVSFETEHFNSIAGLFKTSSNSSRDAYQQLHRIRNISDQQILICVERTRTAEFLPTTAEDAEDYIRTVANPVGFNRNFVNFDRDIHGNYSYPTKDNYYYTKIDTLVERGLDRCYFEKNLVQYLVNAGYEVKYFESNKLYKFRPELKEMTAEINRTSVEFKSIGKTAQKELAGDIARASEDEPELYERQQQFCEIYRINPADLTADMIVKYGKKEKIRRQFNCYAVHDKTELKFDNYGDFASADEANRKKVKAGFDLLQFVLHDHKLTDFSAGRKDRIYTRAEMTTMLDRLNTLPQTVIQDYRILFRKRGKLVMPADMNFNQKIRFLNGILGNVFDLSFKSVDTHKKKFLIYIDTLPDCGYFQQYHDHVIARRNFINEFLDNQCANEPADIDENYLEELRQAELEDKLATMVD